MDGSELPPAPTLVNIPNESLYTILDTLFEPSPELHKIALPLLSREQFPSYGSFISALRTRLLEVARSSKPSDCATVRGILTAHPRLGAKRIASVLSAGEQAKLRTGEAAELEELRRLNDEYEQKFNGLRYV